MDDDYKVVDERGFGNPVFYGSKEECEFFIKEQFKPSEYRVVRNLKVQPFER